SSSSRSFSWSRPRRGTRSRAKRLENEPARGRNRGLAAHPTRVVLLVGRVLALALGPVQRAVLASFLVLRAELLGLVALSFGLRGVRRACGLGRGGHVRDDRLEVVDDLLHVLDRLVDDGLVLRVEAARVERRRCRRGRGRSRGGLRRAVLVRLTVLAGGAEVDETLDVLVSGLPDAAQLFASRS